MMRMLWTVVAALVLTFAAPAQAASPATASFPGLMGGQIRLADFRGKAVLVVNTASACGYTPQFAGLQALYEARRADGLVIIGAPSNDFGGQEPLSGAKLQAFCDLNFGVTFPMAAPGPVVGPRAQPFYRWARAELGEAATPRWNFHKILIGKDGRALAAFPSAVTPTDPRLAAAIDAALR